jgi:hypothetical protein
MSTTGGHARTASTTKLEPLPSGPPPLVLSSSHPQYAYGSLCAVRLASALDLEAVSMLELGVAGGNGLIELERIAATLSDDYGVRVDAAGFDLGTGMPTPVDYRDVPYVWQRGFFSMDEDQLRARLKSAQLHIGDISRTGPGYLATNPAPIGFISFDMDYYSATVSAFDALFSADPSRFLPRVFCYFDDTIGRHDEYLCSFAGELLAISEFNDRSQHRKLDKIHGLRYKMLPMDDRWIEGMYVLHLFDHPNYCDYVYPQTDRQNPLKNR